MTAERITTQRADRYAVFGHPVAHSRSPQIHAAFARQTGQSLTYARIDPGADAAAFAARVHGFAAEGARGANVTVPFKFDALALVREAGGAVGERAARAGAANTLVFDGPGPSRWRAENTDGLGLRRDLEANAGLVLAGRHVLLVGAGGAGAGVLGPLLEARPARLVVVNRSVERAAALVEAHAALAAAHGVLLQAGGLDIDEPFDLVVNASASSLQGAASPVGAAVLAEGATAVDLMYGAAAKPFLAWARAHRAAARDGLGMLVEQAAEAFWLWRGVRPDTAPVLAALRAEVDAA